MKKMMFAALAVVALAALPGCSCRKKDKDEDRSEKPMKKECCKKKKCCKDKNENCKMKHCNDCHKEHSGKKCKKDDSKMMAYRTLAPADLALD